MKRSLPGFLALVVVGTAVGSAFWLFQRQRAAPQQAALLRRQAATRVLGEHLASRFPGQRALVMANPFTQTRGRDARIYSFEAAGIQGLRQGLGNGTSAQVVFPELRPGTGDNPEAVYVDPKTTTPLSFLLAEDAFDKLAKANPDCNLVVSLIGLPANLSRVAIWNKSGVPRFALLLPDWRMVGNREAVRAAFQSGKIVAAVVSKPGAFSEGEANASDYKTEFNRQFLLVTAENIDELMRRFPQLFPR